MHALKYRMFGIEDGDFRPANQPKELLLGRVESFRRYLPPSISLIVAPKVDFTNRVAEPSDEYELWEPWFARTKQPADGSIVWHNKAAVAIFNADCPLICFHQGEKLVVTHAGYRCLICADSNEKGIIEAALKHFDCDQVKVFMFGGIGSCCWKPEYNDKPEILRPKLCRYPEILRKCKTETENPKLLSGTYVSVNLYRLASELLMYFGVPRKNISTNNTCTCCAEKDGEPIYWSHTRFQAGQQSIDGRNMAVAWLEEQK